MSLVHLCVEIIKIIENKYDAKIYKKSVDIAQIKNICDLSLDSVVNVDFDNSITLSEIKLSSPEFKKISKNSRKKNFKDVLKSEDFQKTYLQFIRLLHACLKIGIEIFESDDDIIVIKNNYHLIKTLENRKKRLIADHINVLKMQSKNVANKIDAEYDDYSYTYIMKVRIIDKILEMINKMIKNGIMQNNDTLLSLILPYFYQYQNYIEEYNVP